MREVTHEYADLGGVRLHCAHAGRGPLIVFLHGFPQCWYMWRHQLQEFSRDHLALAPDLRGYNLSSKPEHLHEYSAWHAARDVRALAMSVGSERFVLVGHDWGAATAWTFALHHPELLDALVILATPHPPHSIEPCMRTPSSSRQANTCSDCAERTSRLSSLARTSPPCAARSTTPSSTTATWSTTWRAGANRAR
jgi:pimeloyl-ACP methyl ester carboxylesterase